MTNRIAVKNPQGKQTGYIEGGVYYRSFTDAHMLRKPQALAMSVDVIEQLTRNGATRLVFTHAATGVKYRATLAHFLDKSLTIDRGYGRQLALPLAGWMRETPGASVKEPAPDRRAQVFAKQPRMI